MIKSMLNFIKCLIFGCEDNSPKQKALEDEIQKQEEKLKEIEDEKTDLDSVIERLNSDD